MRANIINEKGTLIINEEVIAQIAGLTAVECFGIVVMTTSGIKDGLVQILKREHLTKGIKVEINELGELIIDFHIIVSYGVSIATVSQNLLSNVAYNIEKYTSLKVNKINIFVDGVKVID